MSYTNQYICGSNGDAYDVQAVSLSNGSEFWYESFGTQNDAGVRVTGYTALGNCHVWKALNVLASDFGQLPVKLFRKQRGRSVEVENVPQIDCLRMQPNEWMVPSVYKETSMWIAALWGNSVTWINRPNPRTIQLVPLRPDRVSVQIDDELTGNFFYIYTLENGSRVAFDRQDVLHIPGLSCNGLWGMSLLDVARNVIGGGLALEKHVNRSFANGARPSGVLKHPGKMSAEGRANLRDEWNRLHQGSDNAGRVAVLWEGMDYGTIAMTMETAQVEALRRLDREFVSELFNLPLFKLNSLENSSTRANLEQQNQEYVQGSLMRWIVRHTEEWSRKLLTPEQRQQGYYYRVITEALLRGDTQARYSAYGVAIQNRIMNANEAREREDMEPYEGGDEYGNPHIDPKAANDANNGGGRPPGATEKATVLLEAAIAHVVKTEINAVCRGAASKDFRAWCDTYYGVDGGWYKLVAKELKPLADFIAIVASEVTFDVVMWAAVHGAESQRLLSDLQKRTAKERLADTVKTECDQWPLRAKR